jgi:PAS domain S-box-containing protein
MSEKNGIPSGDKPFVQDVLSTDLLRESNILNLLPAAVYVCDMSGIIRKYNEQAVQLWGRRPEIGDRDERFCGAFKLYYPDGTYLPHDETPVAACLKDGLPRKNLEVVIERPDLSRSFVKVNIVPLKDEHGEQVGMINCFHEITDQKRTEKELLRKTVELQDYVDNGNIGLHWVDKDGIIVWANKAELDLLGYSMEEYIGQKISKFHLHQEKINDILTRLDNGDCLEKYESELLCKDGTVKTVQISSSVYREEGKFIHTRCFTIDVTEQKKLFSALANSEERYKRLVNSLPAGVYTCDKEGAINFYNEVAASLWGYRPDTNTNKLKYCACYKVYLNGIFVPADQTPMAIALQTGQSFRNLEVVMERPNGQSFIASVNIDPLYDESKNIVGAINVFQDISSIKQAELKLKESETRYRELIQTLQTPLYTTDAFGRIMLYNKAAADLWGREPKIGEDLWCGSYKILKTDGSHLPLDSCPMAICLKEQRPVYNEEILVIRPDGSIRHVAPHPQPVYDSSGNLTGAVNMLVDITEMKIVEKALRESEENYRNLANSLEQKVKEKTKDLIISTEELKKSEERYHKMVDEVEDYAIILLDKNGVVQNWNKGAEKIKGYKEEEIVGKSFQAFYLPQDREDGLPLKLLKDASENGKAIHEGWRRRKDGSIFWGNSVLTALHDNQDNIIGFSKVTRDLTELKLAEDKNKEYLSQLEFQNEELEQFTYAASHDMKEPLRKIHLYNSYIADNPSNKLDNKSAEYLKRSLQAVDRMKNLIEDLLAYSRVTSNVEGYEAVEMNNLIKDLTLDHKEELDEKGVNIELGKLPVIWAVKFQIRQLMFNLIDNAIKYKHPERNAIITLSSKVVYGYDIVECDAEPNTLYHEISVEDNGVGFDSQHAQKIFEVFQRLNNLSNAKGSGIGLAICKRIIQNHKGFIRAVGRPGEGARFSIYLPDLKSLVSAKPQ